MVPSMSIQAQHLSAFMAPTMMGTRVKGFCLHCDQGQHIVLDMVKVHRAAVSGCSHGLPEWLQDHLIT